MEPENMTVGPQESVVLSHAMTVNRRVRNQGRQRACGRIGELGWHDDAFRCGANDSGAGHDL